MFVFDISDLFAIILAVVAAMMLLGLVIASFRKMLGEKVMNKLTKQKEDANE